MRSKLPNRKIFRHTIGIFLCVSVAQIFAAADTAWVQTKPPGNLPFMEAYTVRKDGTLFRWYKTASRIYYTSDLGKKWEYKEAKLSTGPILLAVDRIVAHPDGDLFSVLQYSVTMTGLFRSADGGATWNHLGDSLGIPGLLISSTGTLYAFKNVGMPIQKIDIMVSKDKGAKWELASSPITIFHSSIRPNGSLLIQGKNPAGITGIHESKDEGKTWTLLSNPSNVSLLSSNRDGCLAVGGVNMAFSAIRKDGDSLSGYKIANFGNRVNDIVFSENKKIVLSIAGRGVYFENDTGGFATSNRGMLLGDSNDVRKLFYDVNENLWIDAGGTLYVRASGKASGVRHVIVPMQKVRPAPYLIFGSGKSFEVLTSEGFNLIGRARRSGQHQIH